MTNKNNISARSLLLAAQRGRLWPLDVPARSFGAIPLARDSQNRIVPTATISPRYTIPATLIEEALLGSLSNPPEPVFLRRYDEDTDQHGGVFIGPSIQVASVRVTGNFSLENQQIDRALYFSNCVFDEPVVFKDCQLRQVSFTDCVLHSINAERASIQHSFILQNCLVRCGVNVDNSDVGGALNFEGTRIIQSPKENAISAKNVQIGRALYLNDGFCSNGRVNLASAIIEGPVNFRKGSFIAEPGDGMALSLFHARIDGELRWADVTQLDGRIDFRWSSMITLADRRNSWPGAPNIVGDFRLDGMRYEQVAHDTDSDLRIRWLKCQRPEDLGKYFKPQPWTQMASALRYAGHETPARQVLIAREKHRMGMYLRRLSQLGLVRRLGVPAPMKMLGQWISAGLLHISVLHGYSPTRGLMWSLLAIAAGATVFSQANREGLMWPAQEEVLIHMAETNSSTPPPQYEQFNALMYSLDLFVPLLDLRQQSHWTPAPPPAAAAVESENMAMKATRAARYKWAMWAEACFGWLMTALTGLAFSGVLKRD